MTAFDTGVFRALAEDIIAVHAGFVFKARGRSMAPFIRDGASVLVEPCSSKVRVGDVLLVKQSDGNLLLHRLVKKTKEGLITRGDACVVYDDPFRQDDIIGKAAGSSGFLNSMHLYFPCSYFLVICLHFFKHPLLVCPVQTIRKKILQLQKSLGAERKKQAESDIRI